MCSSLKFILEASQLNLAFFCVLNLLLLGIQPPLTVRNFEMFGSEPISHKMRNPKFEIFSLNMVIRMVTIAQNDYASSQKIAKPFN